jgi:hypothetical protein
MKNYLNRSWNWRISSILLLFLGTGALAQNAAPLTDSIYDVRVHTVLLHSNVSENAFPVIRLNTEERFLLSFDDFSAINANYQFSLMLCDASWKPVPLQPNEYITGMTYEQLNNYKFSSGTYQKYIRYEASFPTENMNVKYAGNYILKVYRNFNENDIVLTKRCYVLNSTVNISSNIHQANDIDSRYTKQEADVEVDLGSLNIPNPYNEAKLVILQNGRYDNAITGLAPKYIVGAKYNYDYEDQNLFYGGNEFRAFDTRNIRSVGINVQTKYIDTAIHVILKPDDARGAQQHLALPDYNGDFIIDSKSAGTAYQVDYAWVTFTLNSFSSDNSRDIYVLGAFNSWKPSEEFKMTYDEGKKIYQCTVKLKQGYYGYAYAQIDNKNMADMSFTEGSHFETENDYYIFFYRHDNFRNYDELVGYQKANTGSSERR